LKGAVTAERDEYLVRAMGRGFSVWSAHSQATGSEAGMDNWKTVVIKGMAPGTVAGVASAAALDRERHRRLPFRGAGRAGYGNSRAWRRAQGIGSR
jgi:hypothetical protein